MKQIYSKGYGFTLLELMVTLAIGAVLMMIAVPSLISFQRNAELTSGANRLMASINAARGEAMKQGTNALVVPINNGADWNAGWIVFVYKFDAARTTPYVYDAAFGDKIIQTQDALPSYINVTDSIGGTAPYIMYDASGYSKTKANGFLAMTLNMTRTDLSGAELLTQTRRIKIASTGRVKVCKPASATDANCLDAG